jgi:predicted nuclease of predicted toxin-antitoxin system
VRVKLDENMPADAADSLTVRGHDVETVAWEGLTGRSDREVVSVCTSERRLLMTLDRGMGDIRAYSPGSHAGIVVFRPESQDAVSVVATMEALLQHHSLEELAGCIVIVRRHLVRIRRPS